MIYAKTKQEQFMIKMNQSFEFKKAYAETRVNEFIKECSKLGFDTAVSVGGLDSIVLYCFIKNMGYNIPGVSVSAIEDSSVRAIHKQLNIIDVKPLKSKYHILKEIGYPIFSKDIARKINVLQNPCENNAVYRNAILTGRTGKYAKVPVSVITKLPDKYIKLLYENPAPVSISDKCCYYMKEKPVQKWFKENNCLPFLGLHADESRRRFMALSSNGCNYFNGSKSRSAPFAIYSKSDILQLAIELNITIPTIYGEIKKGKNGYFTTGAARTGCDICGFGLQFETTRPHRFDILHDTDFKKWDFYVNQMEYGKLFKHIGFNYEQPYIPGENAWK